MSTLLTAQSLHVDTAFGPLFTDLSFTLKKGDRIGLIGHNGCGKSTLLQVLDGTLTPAAGSVALAHHCLMARVEQHLPDALLRNRCSQGFWRDFPPADVNNSAGRQNVCWRRWALRRRSSRSKRQR
jgi:ATPase subunit of ABC transporter with duplicated ATPase domains